MKREPCMSIAELSRLKGVKESALWNRAERVPFPPVVTFSGLNKSKINGRTNYYRRSELLNWFDNSLVRQQKN